MPAKSASKPRVASSTRRKSTKPASFGSHASYDEIARRAYELYLGRGGHHGHDVDDWLQAEHELRQQASESAATNGDSVTSLDQIVTSAGESATTS